MRSKKVLFVGLMAVLAVALTGCKLERGANDTVEQATANNWFIYDGGTFEGGGALHQPQYEQFGVSSADDAEDIFVLWPSGPGKLPRATYRLTVTPGPDPSRYPPPSEIPQLLGIQVMQGSVGVYGYHASNGKWEYLEAGDYWSCSPRDATQCSAELTFKVKDPDITGLRVGVHSLFDDDYFRMFGYGPFAGTYAFKLEQQG